MSKLARFPSAARLAELYRRQGTPKWGPEFQTAIRAVKEEAPPDSRPSQMFSVQCGRNLHAMSRPEADVHVITEYRSNVIEKYDQAVIPTVRRDHVLAGAPFYSGPKLPDFEGTLAAAEELGWLKFHPTVVVDGRLVPFPLIGDLLLFLKEPPHVWAVNLTIKASPEDFDRPFGGKRRARDPRQAAERARLRHAVEERTYDIVAIPTVRITAQDYSANLARNLRWLHLIRIQDAHLDLADVRRVEDAFADAVLQERAPASVIQMLGMRYNIPEAQSRIAFARAVFERRILIDLFDEHILMDLPLRPETKHPLSGLEHWFARRGA